MDPKQAVDTFNFVQPMLFWLIAALISVCAIATVVSQNIVRAATWLLFTLAGTSGLFFLLGADLVGAVQLLVYVGGTLVLVVFGVMLTAQGPFISMKPSGAEWAISVVAGALLMAVLTTGIVSDRSLGARYDADVARFVPKKARAKTHTDPATSGQSATLGESFLGVGVGPPHLPAHLARDKAEESDVIRMNYLLPFELVSVHLLVVLIGAAYLARAKRRRGATA